MPSTIAILSMRGSRCSETPVSNSSMPACGVSLSDCSSWPASVIQAYSTDIARYAFQRVGKAQCQLFVPGAMSFTNLWYRLRLAVAKLGQNSPVKRPVALHVRQAVRDIDSRQAKVFQRDFGCRATGVAAPGPRPSPLLWWTSAPGPQTRHARQRVWSRGRSSRLPGTSRGRRPWRLLSWQ